MKDKYYITEVSNEQDVKEAVSFWERYLPVAKGIGIKKYYWFYQNNPFKKAELWLLKEREGNRTIGVGGIGYRPFILKGGSLIGAVGVDFAIEKEYRTLGPAIKLQKAIMESAKENSDFLYGFPFSNGEVILKYFKYQKIADFSRLVKILRSGSHLKKAINSQFITKTIAIPLDLLLRLRSIKTMWVSGNFIHQDNIEDLHNYIDVLFNKIVHKVYLMGDRNFQYLAWRYFNCPELVYYAFGIKDSDNSLNGLIVYYIQNKSAEIVDFLCSDYDDTHLIDSLFLNFEKYCYLNSFDSIGINIIGSQKIILHFIRMGYWRNKRQQISFFLNTGHDEELLPIFKDIENSLWFFGDVL